MKTEFFMKKALLLIACAGMIVYSCAGQEKAMTKKTDDSTKVSDTIRIASDKLEYDIVIMLISTARPRSYYSQQFLESRNRIFVMEWNQRVLQPSRFNSSLYEQQIDYRANVDYGYEVNYQLYYYFVYFQRTYNQKLGVFPVRI